MLELLSLDNNDRILDLGSGAGIDCFIASKKTGKNGKVIGLDMTDDMLEKANKNNGNLPIFSVSECLTYLQERLKLAKHNLNETEVEKNYFRYIGQVSELEMVIEHIEAELNIR